MLDIRAKTHNESYMHFTAKEVAAAWFRQLCGNASHKLNRQVKLHPLEWHACITAPEYGVFTEYPLVPENGNKAWSNGWRQHFKNKFHAEPTNSIPTREQLIALYKYPAVILDIAITSKDTVVYGIEIKYSSPPSVEKIDYCIDKGIPLFEADASWVLKHTSRPDRLQLRKLF